MRPSTPPANPLSFNLNLVIGITHHRDAWYGVFTGPKQREMIDRIRGRMMSTLKFFFKFPFLLMQPTFTNWRIKQQHLCFSHCLPESSITPLNFCCNNCNNPGLYVWHRHERRSQAGGGGGTSPH